MKRRVMAFIMAAFTALTVSGCWATESGYTDEEIRVVFASTPETLDPGVNVASDANGYIVHLFEGLIRYRWDGNGIEPGTAESWSVSEDGLVWTFKLRDDAKWSDGKDVTAEDFVYSWRRIVDPETASPYALDMGGYIKNALEIIDGSQPPDSLGVRAVDAKTFEVTLVQPCEYFDEIAAFPVFVPLRRDTIEQNGNRWTRKASTYISNGAFKMESFKLDDSLVIVPNEYYYESDRIRPQRIVFEFLADEVAQLNAFEAGAVHLAQSYPDEERQRLLENGTLGGVPALGTYYITFNLEEPPFDDINVRKALSLAIDREYIANVLLMGAMFPAEAFVGNGFFDMGETDFRDVGGSYWHNDEYEKNKELARQALADAGYPNGEGFPRVEYMTDFSTRHQAIAEALQQMWKDTLNIHADISLQEWNVFIDSRRNGNFQMARNTWIGDYNDPMTLLQLLQTDSGNNDGRYSNNEFDDYLEISRTSSNRAERMDAMHKAETLAMGEFACGPIMYPANEFLAKPELKGWSISPLGVMFFHTAYIDNL